MVPRNQENLGVVMPMAALRTVDVMRIAYSGVVKFC